jgi:hypothetical protein
MLAHNSATAAAVTAARSMICSGGIAFIYVYPELELSSGMILSIYSMQDEAMQFWAPALKTCFNG